jgi:hypothetical protein
MGGSLDLTRPMSGWGACAAQDALFRPGEGLLVVTRRTHDSSGDQILVPQPSLSRVRHDHSSKLVCTFILTHTPTNVNLIFGEGRRTRSYSAVP